MTVVDLLEALVQPSLLSAPPVVSDAVGSTTVTAVVYDSRRAVPGAVFVALRGQKDDGARFAPQAVARGAVLVVAEIPVPAGHQGAWLTVPDARLALALLADRFHGHPSGTLRVIGITGTNGKTTTAYLLRSILEASGQRCGVLGTVVYSLGREDREATRTTPEAPDVQQMFGEMLENGCTAAVMEVSSHALALKRVDGVQFRGRRLQQSDTRPPRLPRRHGDLFRRQAPAVRDASAKARRASSTSTTRRDSSGGHRRPAGHLRHPQRRRRHAGAFRLFAVGTALHGPHAAWCLAGEVDAGRAAQRLQRAGGHRDRRRARCATRCHRIGHRAVARCAGTVRGCLAARPTTSASSWTTRTPTTRSRTCSRPRACCRRAGSSRCSAAAAIAIARSAR